MTKKWSSTASLDGQTKRQASKAARREAGEMAKVAKEYGLDPIGDFLRREPEGCNLCDDPECDGNHPG